EVIRRRLDARREGPSDARWPTYLRQRMERDRLGPDEPHRTVETGGDLTSAVDSILPVLWHWRAPPGGERCPRKSPSAALSSRRREWLGRTPAQLDEGVEDVAAGEDPHQPAAFDDRDRTDALASHDTRRVRHGCGGREGQDGGRHHVLDVNRRRSRAAPRPRRTWAGGVGRAAPGRTRTGRHRAGPGR